MTRAAQLLERMERDYGNMFPSSLKHIRELQTKPQQVGPTRYYTRHTADRATQNRSKP